MLNVYLTGSTLFLQMGMGMRMKIYLCYQNNLLTNHNWTVLYLARKARVLQYLEKFLYLQSALKIVNSVQEIKSYAFQ